MSLSVKEWYKYFKALSSFTTLCVGKPLGGTCPAGTKFEPIPVEEKQPEKRRRLDQQPDKRRRLVGGNGQGQGSRYVCYFHINRG